MGTISLDLRERILASYDQKEGNREEIASRYRVSLGLVKKLLQQRRRTGDIAPRHHFSGPKPRILPAHEQQMKLLLARKPDLTLAELRQAMQLDCTLPAIHYVLLRLGLTYKKRHSVPANKTVPILREHVARGGASRRGSTRPN
jgi:transposase